MRESIKIRTAKPEDALNLCMLKIQVWLHTYATEGIRTEFSEYLAEAFTKEKMLEDLLDQDKLILVAEQGQHMLGCADLHWNSFNSKCGEKAPELAVLYVSEHFQGQGLGYRLLSEMEQMVQKKGGKGLWLTAYHQNEKAIAFYNRQGYQHVGETYFTMDGNQYENWILYKEI